MSRPELPQQATLPQTILVAEDEVLIRYAICDYLRDCGYHVIEAGSGAEAISVLKSKDITVDLVFSDVQMPGTVDGFGLARWVRENRPAIRIILTSGVVKTAEYASELCAIGPIESKPYHFQSLVDRIRRLLADN